MILVSTVLNISDNSGPRTARCIHVYNKKSFGSIGDTVLVSIKTYNVKKKIKKGEMFLALIIRTKYVFNYNNSFIKFKDNAAVLLNKKNLPIGTRIFGLSLRNLRLINRKVFLMLQYVL